MIFRAVEDADLIRKSQRGDVEAFNLLNRVRMGGPDSTVTSANFGLIRSQGNDPRRLQFGGKVIF